MIGSPREGFAETSPLMSGLEEIPQVKDASNEFESERAHPDVLFVRSTSARIKAVPTRGGDAPLRIAAFG